MEEKVCSTRELIELLSVVERQVQRDVKDGVAQKVGHGQYLVTLEWINHQRRKRGFSPLSTLLPEREIPQFSSPLLEEKDQRIRELEKQVETLQQEKADLQHQVLALKQQATPKTPKGEEITFPLPVQSKRASASSTQQEPVSTQVSEDRPPLVWEGERVRLRSLAHHLRLDDAGSLMREITMHRRIPYHTGKDKQKTIMLLDQEGMRLAYDFCKDQPGFDPCPDCPHGVLE